MNAAEATGRMRPKDAAVYLAVSIDWLYELVGRGALSVTSNGGKRGTGRRIYLDRGEVEAFAAGGPPAAKAYRETRGLRQSPKRGRRTRA